MEWILGIIGGAAGIALILNKVIKKKLTPEVLAAWDIKVVKFSHTKAQPVGYYIGRICTLNVTKWPFVGVLWENLIEPWVIIFLRLGAKYLVQIIKDVIAVGIPNGLLSDNAQPPKPEE